MPVVRINWSASFYYPLEYREGFTTIATTVEEAVRAIIGENAAAVADYKKGKTASLQFLIGKAMGQLKGRARPDMLKEIFEKNLG